ncbi:amidohydrolase family protein [bacterium]|nr:amidohydrolase family protein [bacterium]
MPDENPILSFPSAAIWERLDPSIPFKGDWLEFRHRQQGEFLHELAKFAPLDIGLSHIGISEEGRVLHTLRFGKGPRKVLLWARQHGDEPDCSAGLAMALTELLLHSEEPHYALILERLELGVFPMVNPDGVARFTRRNAQGIDVNRDAVAGATAEGRAIMAIKESFKPEYCFNLHDMSPRKTAGDNKLVAIAYQAGPFEPRDIDNPVRLKAKHIIGLMKGTVDEHAAGHQARYTADYMHRAFGDTMMRMGVSSILIEAGGWYEDRGGEDFVRRLFALAVLRGLHAIAAGEDANASGALYETLPFDAGNRLVDLKLSGCHLMNGSGTVPFRSDVAINVDWRIGRINEPVTTVGLVENLGDLEDLSAKREIALPGCIAMPGFVVLTPHPLFARDKPTVEEAAPFVRAGITTLVCGVGPFGSNRARESWLEATTTAPPPLNIIAFERVSSLREVRMRHGMAELAGLLVQDLEIAANDLLNFMHLFHPAHASALGTDLSGRTVGLDLFFQGAASPTATHMHLHLSAVPEKSGRTLVRPEELRTLVDEFLRSPSQITMTLDPKDEPIEWLPLLVGYGGLSAGRVPEPGFLGQVLRRYGVSDVSGLIAALNMLTLTNARAFRLGNVGKVQIGQRADVAVFDDPLANGSASAVEAAPRLVLINGNVAWDKSAPTITRDGLGTWHLASAPQVR